MASRVASSSSAPATPAAAQKYTTTGTVSSPLDLESLHAPKGEHEAVPLNGSASSKISPKPKVTLTSLTLNNVSYCPQVVTLRCLLQFLNTLLVDADL